MSALALQGVGMAFGARTALAGVDLRVEAGERVAVVGPSGAGKSTLLRLCGGRLAPTAGSVRVLGADVQALRGRALRRLQRQIGTIEQGPYLVGPLRVVHNVNAGRLGGWPWWQALAALAAPGSAGPAHEALAAVGLGGRESERTERLSGGEQQRVAVARLLVQRPALVLADEPLAALDPARAGQVLDLLLGLAGATVIVTLHDVAVAVDRFDRVVALREGRVAFDVPAARVGSGELEALYALEAAG